MRARLAILITVSVVVVVAALGGIAYGVSQAVSTHHHRRTAAGTVPPTTVPVTAPAPGSTSTTAPSPSTTAPPPGGTSVDGLPNGAWSLPNGTTTQGVVELGFPDTGLGGVSMAYEALDSETTLDPGVAATVDNTIELNPPADVVSEAEQASEQTRKDFGLPQTGPVSATIAAQVQGCWVGSASPTEVTGGLEGEFVESDASTGEQYANFAVPFVVRWTGSDWRVDETAGNAVHLPTSQLPPATGQSANGWHACSGGAS